MLRFLFQSNRDLSEFSWRLKLIDFRSEENNLMKLLIDLVLQIELS